MSWRDAGTTLRNALLALDASSQHAVGLATQAYVNDLADTILERLPTRQFQKLQLEEEITEVELEETITEPVRLIQLKSILKLPPSNWAETSTSTTPISPPSTPSHTRLGAWLWWLHEPL